MTIWKIILRSLYYFRRNHLWVILGTVMSTAILVGGLIIGDSVRFSMKQIVLDRLGDTEFALNSGDRFFRMALAEELSAVLQTTVAPILQTKGIGIAEGGRFRVNKVHVTGVDARFGKIGRIDSLFINLSPNEAIINLTFASNLGLRIGDEFLLRIEKSDAMPRDAPLALDAGTSIARRYRVKAIASDSQFGRFNLKSDQVAPNTVFVALSSLSDALDIQERANILLVSEKSGGQIGIQDLHDALKQCWTLEDGGFQLVVLPDRNSIELRSNRIFLDPAVVDAAKIEDRNAQSIVTYFVNGIRAGNRSTPYSFVSAPGPPIVPSGLKDNEMIINDWLASDLNVKKADTIRLTYYILGPMRDLVEVHSDFLVHSIVPLRGLYADQELLPDFPGLSEEKSCRDWHPGIPINLDKIRKKDEAYWSRYRGTPKAFITLNAAREMWQNRFGVLTAVRFTGTRKSDIERRLTRKIDPGLLGFHFREVKKEGLLASSQSVDFTQLFLGLSFFVIAAALLLTALLFVFSIEKRSEETGLYLALGIPGKQIRRLLLMEGFVLVSAGSLLGGFAGVLYTHIILHALKTVWQGAVGTSALQLSVQFPAILMGISSGIILAFLTIAFVTSKHMKQPISSLQKGIPKIEKIVKGRPRLSVPIGAVCLLASLILVVMTILDTGMEAVGSFFIAGSLFLVSGIAFGNILLYGIGKRVNRIRLHMIHLGIRNTARRRFHSLTLIALLASGLFIVFTVGANRKSAIQDSERRESGTGGFALFGESSIPVLSDLNSVEGRKKFGLEEMEDVRFVQFRVREGDDASCLNLNRVANPQLIGVNPDELMERGAFTFTKTIEEVDPENPWSILKQPLGDVIPGIADQTVITWGLGKSVGDTLTYVDESGSMIHIVLAGGLANSIFQGNIILSEELFLQKYPSISGYRLFLIDAPHERIQELSRDISWAIQDNGLDLVPASVRLDEFNKVENTYLSIFLILGSFGLLLGSIGIAIVVWRHVNDQRGELALLRAMGFSRRSLQSIILSEHISLLIAGVLLGVLAAICATFPTLLTTGTNIPFITMLILLLIVLLNGIGWTVLATRFTIRGDLIPALRQE